MAEPAVCISSGLTCHGGRTGLSKANKSKAVCFESLNGLGTEEEALGEAEPLEQQAQGARPQGGNMPVKTWSVKAPEIAGPVGSKLVGQCQGGFQGKLPQRWPSPLETAPVFPRPGSSILRW